MIKINFRIIFIPLILFIFLLSSCVAFRKPIPANLPKDIPLAWATDINIKKLPITASLIDLIGKQKVLCQLIDEALKNNPNLKATALRLKSAGYLLTGSRSKLLPQMNAEFSKGQDNQKIDIETSKQKISNSNQISLGINWELDIWGKLTNEREASKQSFIAQKYEYLHIRDALVARIIQAWIEQVAIRRSINIERERIDALQRIEIILAERYKSGIGSIDEMSAAKSRTEIAKADLSSRNAVRQRSIRKLEVLLGRYPKGNIVSNIELPEIKSPPTYLPSSILLNRPDIQVALARVKAASNTSRAADKAILPELRLSGQVFRQSTNLNDLGKATSNWGILGSLFQPLFEGKKIISISKAMRAEAEASLMDLHEVVLLALKEVEDALNAERDLTVQSLALEMAFNESKKGSLYYEDRYKQGIDTLQSLLIAKEQEMSVKIRLNEIKAERWSNRIDLALALGLGINENPTMPLGNKKQ